MVVLRWTSSSNATADVYPAATSFDAGYCRWTLVLKY